jgi:hypothetical protein
VHAGLASVAAKQGKRDIAAEHLAEVRERLATVSHANQLDTIVQGTAYELLVGNATAVAEVCWSTLQEARAYGYVLVEAKSLNSLGRANLALRQLADAEAAFQEAQQVTKGRFFQSSVEALAGMGAVALQRGLYQAGEERFRQVLGEAWPVGLLPEVLEAVVGLAEIRVQTGDPATARHWLRVSLAHPSTVHLVRVHAQEVLKGLEDESAPDAMSDPQAALEGIVTALLASGEEGSQRQDGQAHFHQL